MTEAGQPNAAVLELVFWEAIKRCAQDETVPLSLTLRGDDDQAGISFGDRIPSELWQYMETALNELRAVAEAPTNIEEQ